VTYIARKGGESSERLGHHRWVVERTHAWLNRYRRLKIRYERTAEIHLTFLQLGCALICWNFVQQFCWGLLQIMMRLPYTRTFFWKINDNRGLL